MGGAGFEPASSSVSERRSATELPARVTLSPPMPASPASATRAALGAGESDRSHHGSAEPSRTSIGISGQGLEPRSPRSERDVLPLDDPEELFLRRLCLARHEPNDVFQASRLPFDPGSTVHTTERRPTWRSFGARSLARRLEMRRLKLTLIRPVDFQHTAAENLSLSGGASIRSRAVSS
jgi:hypothetical protein